MPKLIIKFSLLPSTSCPKGENASVSFSSVVNLERPDRNFKCNEMHIIPILKCYIQNSGILHCTI
jgi:hypothetical protein